MSQKKKEIKPWDRDLEAEAAFLEQHALEHTQDMPEPDAKEGLARLLQRIDEMEKEKKEHGVYGLHERKMAEGDILEEEVSAAEEIPGVDEEDSVPGMETTEGGSVIDKKKGRGKVRWKVLAVLAAVLVLLFAVQLGTTGKRIYTPEAVVEPKDGEVIVKINNDERIKSEVEEEEIYQEIENRLGILALRLGYKPQGTELYEVDILEDLGEARIYFIYNEKTFFVYISRDFSGAGGYIKADGDGEVVEVAENFILDRQINIIKDKNNEGQNFLYSEISYENMFYTISGNIELEEFLKIIEEIYKKDA